MSIRCILIAAFMCVAPVAAWADMTDAQVLEYVVKEQGKGTPQNEIAQQLMKKGVSVKQLQRVKEKYGRQRNAPTEKRELQSPSRLRVAKELPEPVADDTTLLMQPVATEEKIKVYGRDLFGNENLSFEPNMNMATPPNYVLGAGDVLYIDVYGASQCTIEAEVSPDGKIVVEEYGPISVGGLTVESAARRVKSALSGVYADSNISLTLGQTRSIQVHVFGEAATPGSYTLSGFATLFHALYAAGGVSEIGSLREVKLYRNDRHVATFDLYDYILNGKMSGNARLQDGDAIVVSPYLALVNIAGKAKRPMYYEMKPDESIGQAIRYAGGFAADAYQERMRLVRKAGNRYSVHNIDATNMENFRVMDGDSLSIDSIAVRYDNMVEVKGAVFHPGQYELGNGVTSVKTLVQCAAGVTETAMTQRAFIQRMRKDRTLETVRIDLQGILNGSQPDVQLCNEDVLFVPNNEEAQLEQTLSIYGDVYEPGIYAFAHNTTVEDMVLLAGGLKKSASTQVRVARRVNDRDAASTQNRVQHFDLTLQQGLPTEGEETFVLQPDDEVYVLRSPSYSDPANVEVEGEVNYAGTYSLQAETRISDLLEMCGGLTPEAAQNGVYVMRQMTDDELRMRQKRLDAARYGSAYNIEVSASQLQAGAKTLPISDSLLVEQYMREDCYKVAVNVQEALKNRGGKEDLVLQDGDHVVVNRQMNTVRLSGAVAYQGAVPYVKGKTLKHYLRQGGVPASHRNIKMAYVIGPNGQAQSGKRNLQVEPGSEVVLRQSTDALTTAQRITIFTTVGSTLATVAAVVISVLK